MAIVPFAFRSGLKFGKGPNYFSKNPNTGKITTIPYSGETVPMYRGQFSEFIPELNKGNRGGPTTFLFNNPDRT